jgi:glycosyltransferase involved in cell wall biosynthesis
MLYITLDDGYSSVYQSQVIDVCTYISKNFDTRVRLIAFFSPRVYFTNRKKIKKAYKHCIILPLFPLQRWKWNVIPLLVINFFLRHKTAICRNPFATNLGVALKKYSQLKKIVYDGRGATYAEWNEYNVTPNDALRDSVKPAEKVAVGQADFRIAVSQKLVEYWHKEFGYAEKKHVVIPTTLLSNFEHSDFTDERIKEVRDEFGFDEKDVVLVYSGSAAGWQSFNLVTDFLTTQIQKNNRVKILFLTREDAIVASLKQKFPNNVFVKWVDHHFINLYLAVGDYGILIREQSKTNSVASPTKFAEYLALGLPVLISENLGDYSEFVMHHKCGWIVTGADMEMNLHKRPIEERQRLVDLSKRYFYKNSAQNHLSYTMLLQELDII